MTLYCPVRRITPAAVGKTAVRAAIHEATATPKPGLVCPDSAGAHRDMDITTMVASALSLEPYFRGAAALGMDDAEAPPQDVFRRLRGLGRAAEETMLASTCGVNTHKGLIFSLGILAAATGRNEALDRGLDCASVCATAATLVRGLTENDFGPFRSLRRSGLAESGLLRRGRLIAGRSLTAGEKFFLLYGIKGIRGEAEQGFPHVLAAKAEFDRWIGGHSLNIASINALLLLMRDMADTNVLHRGGLAGLELVRDEARRALDAGGAATPEGMRLLRAMQRRFIVGNLSPGGCADLLAIVLFFHFLATEPAAPDPLREAP